MEVRLSHRAIDVVEHVQRRDDVEDRDAGDSIIVVESQSVCDSSAAIVPDHVECVEPEVVHHRDLVVGHGALGVCRVLGVVGGSVGVAVAA